MKFQNYVSALFYLQESLKYLSTPLQEEVKLSLNKVIKEGGEDLECANKGFTVWSELNNHVPEILLSQLTRWSPKETFKKSEVRLSFYAYSETREDIPQEEYEEEMEFCGGKLHIQRKVSNSSLKFFVTISRPKEINDNDISMLAHKLSSISQEISTFE